MGRQFAVVVFFVLSGNVLTRRFIQSSLSGVTLTLHALPYAILKRYIRLVVPVSTSLLLSWFLYSVVGSATRKQVAAVTGSIGWFGPDTIVDTDGVGRGLIHTLFNSLWKVWTSGNEGGLNNVLWTMNIELRGSYLVFLTTAALVSNRAAALDNAWLALVLLLFFFLIPFVITNDFAFLAAFLSGSLIELVVVEGRGEGGWGRLFWSRGWAWFGSVGRGGDGGGGGGGDKADEGKGEENESVWVDVAGSYTEGGGLGTKDPATTTRSITAMAASLLQFAVIWDCACIPQMGATFYKDDWWARHNIVAQSYVYADGFGGIVNASLHTSVFFELIGAVVLIYAVQTSSSMQCVLSSHPLQYLGKISFSVYLVHLPTLMIISPQIFSSMSGSMSYDESAGCTLIVMIPIWWAAAHAFYRVVDSRALRWSAIAVETVFPPLSGSA